MQGLRKFIFQALSFNKQFVALLQQIKKQRNVSPEVIRQIHKSKRKIEK